MSWALNNHWLVNFKSSQSGRIPLRYRLTTGTGPTDAAAAARFAAEMAVPPVAMRDIAPTGKRSDSYFSAANPAVLVTTKPGEDKGCVALRLQNLTGERQVQAVTFTGQPAAARAADPIEHPREGLGLEGKTLNVEVAPLEIRTVLVRFAR
jgi:alpha-mannosidase